MNANVIQTKMVWIRISTHGSRLTTHDSRGSFMTRSEIIDFLKKNKAFFKKRFKVNSIGLFGSCAREENTENSDIDIIVDMPSSFDNFFELKEFLENGLNSKIDLGLEDSLRLLIKNKIQNEIIYV